MKALNQCIIAASLLAGSVAPERLTFDMHRKDGSLVSFRVELVNSGHASYSVSAMPRTPPVSRSSA